MPALFSSSILGFSFCNLLQAQSPASSKIFQTGRNSDGKPIVTIRLQASGDNEDQLTNEYVFASEKGFLGPSSNPTDQSGFANKENTVFGVSYEPVTKACFVKLFLLNASGTLVFVNNVNTRAAVGSFCASKRSLVAASTYRPWIFQPEPGQPTISASLLPRMAL